MKVTVASAGTGKTSRIVLRVLAAIGEGVPLRRIACVTYTRSAAAELRVRLGQGLATVEGGGEYLGHRGGERAAPRFNEAALELEGATVTTIHGFIADCLRYTAPVLGLDPHFESVSEWEAEASFEEAVRSMLLTAGREGAAWERIGDPAPLLLRLFRRRSLVERFLPDPGDPRSEALVRLFGEAHAAFERRLGGGRLGPGELERMALRLVRVAPALERLARRWRILMVDEYQDVNPLQGAFFRALEGTGIAIEVVGDPKQAIYGFRNADVEEFRRARREGETTEPLGTSYRHAPAINAFLTELTATLVAGRLGLEDEDAPPVRVREATGDAGGVEVHWLSHDRPLGSLRLAEAWALARRLREVHESEGIPFAQMAVVARSHESLAIAEGALVAAGVPAVLKQGRALSSRPEVRDIHHALRAAVEPAGPAFLAWLRGPLARLSPADLLEVASAEDPLARLATIAPAAAAAYRRLRSLIALPPLEAAKAIVREPLFEGRSLYSMLDRRSRRNVDELLGRLSAGRPDTLELLLHRLRMLTGQDDSAEVPGAGEGVQLMTVHASKGLEWTLVAVFDAGRGPASRSETPLVDPSDGTVVLAGGPGYSRVRGELARREEAESYRLLYVAASRSRRRLIVTGSTRRGEPRGWATVLTRMGLGPDAGPGAPFPVRRHDFELPPPASRAVMDPAVEAAPWAEMSFPVRPVPPVRGPSSLEPAGAPFPHAAAEQAEPVAPGLVAEGEALPGRAAAVGTLVHYAISQSWRADDEEHLANLAAQEVMFPYSPDEREEIMGEVTGLLANYWSMLGANLPDLAVRESDEAELPMILPQGEDVWQGVIDRLYRVGGELVLEDYKTDRRLEPERYLGQLAVYAQAISRVRGSFPRARLVFLRHRSVHEFGRLELEAAWSRLERAGV